MSFAPQRRFWTRASVRPDEEGFAVALDARPLRTPAGATLRLPAEPLAAAIAAEWDALETEVAPHLLPLTRLANSAIDRVAPQRAAVAAQIARYGGTDLVCYRAEAPEVLADRQAAAWDPWLRWAGRSLGAPLLATSGVMPERQPAASLAALAAAVAAEEAFGLVALHDLVALSGSLVLGLAVRRGALDPGEAWALSRLDETWQAEQWGLDSEAERAAGASRGDFLAAARFSALLA
ncbi:MAG TPA: ATP12 family protein [Amaricoccus sp.]|nr:ATP12 family protein [Amaricoccus sp.]